MARRNRPSKIKVLPDSRFNSYVVSKLMNRIMRDGKKSTAESIVYGAMEIMGKQDSRPPVTVLEQAIKNATPQLEVKSRRIGGATYQVPVEVRTDRGLSLAIRWILAASLARQGKTMAEKLAAELSDAAKGQGATIKKRDDTHKMAEANRAFAHYRW